MVFQIRTHDLFLEGKGGGLVIQARAQITSNQGLNTRSF